MKKLFFIALLSLAMLPAMAQEHNCNNCPHHKQHQQGGKQATCAQQAKRVNSNGIAMEIANAFPTAKSVKKEAKWTVVYNAKKEVIGYAVYSKPASDGIKGYAGETPLLIALDPNEKILSVQLLDNMETPSYLSRVINAGLLKSWNGMKAKKAAKKDIDAVSGATFSSQSIINSLQAALKKLY